MKNIRQLKLFPVCLILLILSSAIICLAQEPAAKVFTLAWQYYHEGKQDLAVKELEKFLLTNPQSPSAAEAWFYLASWENNSTQAIKKYQDLLQKYPLSPWAIEAQYAIGFCYYLNEKYSEALPEFRNLLTFYSQSNLAENAQYWVGVCLLANKLYDLALIEFQKVIVNYPRSDRVPWARMGMGDVYLAKGEYASALLEYQKVKDNYPDANLQSVINYKVATINEIKGNKTVAVELYNQLLIEYPRSSEARMAQERLRILQGIFTVQVGAFREKAYAVNLASRLQKQKYRDATFNAYVVEWRSVQDELWYRVRIGEFGNKAEAEEFARLLQEKESQLIERATVVSR